MAQINKFINVETKSKINKMGINKSTKMKLSNQDSKNRVDKVFKDTIKQVSPTARLNNTFGKKEVIK